MKPLRPALFSTEAFTPQSWDNAEGGANVKYHLLHIGSSFPTVLIGYSAQPQTKSLAEAFAGLLTTEGLNVFLSTSATPLSALSIALGQRSMPLGIYLSVPEPGKMSVLPVAIHGGPIEEQDFPQPRPKFTQKGVLGETNILTPYLKQLSGLLDPFTGKGRRLSNLESPFFLLSTHFTLYPSLQFLNQRDETGPKAMISSDGQSLRLQWPDGKEIPTQEVAATISNYLIRERRSAGTILGPQGSPMVSEEPATAMEISGDALDMSFKAVSADLLLGWWEPGIIAHQGHSPFGDAYLSLAYLLEAWAANENPPS